MRGSRAVTQVRTALRAAGFSESLLHSFTPSALTAFDAGAPHDLRQECAASNHPAASLVAVLYAGATIETTSATPDFPWTAAADIGLVHLRDGRIHPRLRLTPVSPPPLTSDGFVVSDHLPPGPLPDDHVMAPGGSSRTLARLTPRQPIDRALDLGCGSGYQTLLLAQHAAHVVATDPNPRACAATALTLALSAAPPAQVRQTSLFDGITGDFDLIVSSPPFVMAPSREHTYRDSPFPADGLLPALLTGGAARLRPGGWAVLLGSWLHVQAQDWPQRVQPWLADLPDTTAWLAERERLPVPDYVDLWLRDAHRADDHAQRIAWLAYLEDLGAAAVGFGWVALHRRHADRPSPPVPSWCEDVSTAAAVPSGADVLAEFAQRRSVPNAAAILHGRPRLNPAAPTWRGPIGVPSALHWWLAHSDDYLTMSDALSDCASALSEDHADVLVAWLTGVCELCEKGFVTLEPH